MLKGFPSDDVLEDGFNDDDNDNDINIMSNSEQYYKCSKDDTLVSISIRFGVSVSKLKRINKS